MDNDVSLEDQEEQRPGRQKQQDPTKADLGHAVASGARRRRGRSRSRGRRSTTSSSAAMLTADDDEDGDDESERGATDQINDVPAVKLIDGRGSDDSDEGAGDAWDAEAVAGETWTAAPPSTMGQIVADLQSAVKYVWTDTRRRRRNCCLGTFTVFLVVAFIGLLQASIARSPIIFMKLAEDEVGDFDVMVTPSGGSLGAQPTGNDGGGFRSPLLNFTEFDAALSHTPEVVGSSPRWLTFMRLHNAQDAAANGSAILLAIDQAREQALRIGRAWHYAELGPGEAHVSAVLLRRLNVKPNANQNVTLVIDILGTLQQLTGQSLTGLVASAAGGGGGSSAPSPADLLGQLNNVTLNSLLDQAVDAAGGGSELTIRATLAAAWALARSQLPDLALPEWDALPWDTPVSQLAAGALQSGLTVRANFTVRDAIESPGGKFPKALGNVAVIGSRHIHDLIDGQLETVRRRLRELADSGFLVTAAESVLNVTDADFRADVALVDQLLAGLEQFDLDHFALTAVSVYRDRLPAYERDGPGIQLAMITLTDAMARGLGPELAARVSLTTPLASALSTLYFIRLFLDQIFTFVSAVLIGLGALLIYSLLLANVEEKTYEYGMLRALGMRHYVLIELLVIQAMLFALPGIAVGLGAAFLLYVPAAAVLSHFVDVPLDISMSQGSVTTGVLIGLIMPAVANVAPIRRALGSALRDALDVYHDARSATTVTIVRLARVGLSPWQLVVASLLVVMGFVVYYLVPFAFIFNNLPLFLMLLTLILLGMLVGFSVVAQVLEPLAERLFLRLIMWGPDYRQLSDLVRKSLHAHAGRNRKTAAMFTVALAFIVFVGASFALQGVSIRANVQLGLGADVVVLAPTLRSALREAPMRRYLDSEIARRQQGAADAHVVGYSFQTFPLTDLGFVRSSHLSNVAGYPDRRVRVVAVDENYLDVTYAKYYRVSEVASSLRFNNTPEGQPDVIRSLYENAGRLRLAAELAAAGGSLDDPPYVPPPITSDDVRERPSTVNPDGSIVRQTAAEVYLNYTDVAISESLRLEASVDTTTPMYLRLNFVRDVDGAGLNLYLLCKADGMIRKMAGELTYSSYRQLSQQSQMLVSLPAYKRLLRWMRNEGAGYGLAVAGVIGGSGGDPAAPGGDVAADPFEPPKAKLYVRLTDQATSLDREDVINSLRTYISDDITQVLDTTALVDSTGMALDVLNVFFVVVTVIAVTLCFFVLWLSFTANLRENSWEFGVLRALGLTANQVVRVYIYEACALILSSLLLGTIIGLAQASSLTLQFNLFTELPFEMRFPGTLYAMVVLMSFAVAILGALVPAQQFRKKQIAIVLKGM